MFALIGPTASGKSDVALNLARQLGYDILSLDSLSIYKEIDIASAKPSKEELNSVTHYGVNEIFPDEKFDVMKFISIFKKIKKENLIIVGGSSFYLKSMLSGISIMPTLSKEVKEKALDNASYSTLLSLDPDYASKVNPSDTYRILKAFEIYYATSLIPTRYFMLHPPKPVLENIPVYEVAVDRETLRKRIALRTEKMFSMGLIDEISYLEKKYRNRELTALKAIGIKEVLDYFNGKFTKQTLKEKIITHTARLAKRQQTFNKTQFLHTQSAPKEKLFNTILEKEKSFLTV